jgi:prolyl-tRNA synthetase
MIPMSFIEKEKKHIKGFAPELAIITKTGNKKLEEEFAIRPTSESLFGELFSSSVRSHNDLPILYNQ